MATEASLRQRLFSQLLITTIIPIVVAGVATYLFAVRFANKTYDDDLLESAWALGSQVQKKGGVVTFQLPESAEQIFVWDAANKVSFRIDSKKQGFLSGHRDLPLLPAAKKGAVRFHDASIDGTPVRVVVVTMPDAGADDEVTISVSETLNKRHQLATRISVLVIIPQSVLILITALLLRAGLRRGLRSLDELEEAIHARAPNDLTPLPAAQVPRELRAFTGAINALLQKLDEALASQQHFIENAAHQLRTPLTTLKLQADQLIRASTDDPASHAAALNDLRDTIDRTARLSNQLLLLSRAEPGSRLVLQMHALDLRALAHSIGAAWVPRALAQGADIGIEGSEEPCWVCGDELLLGEAINNLVDNALRYGGRGVRVTLRVKCEAGSPELVVEDNGPGIPESQREAVLERFHRVPGSPAGGSGLGLSIVNEIARAHKAKLSLSAPTEGGLRVTLRLMPADEGAR